MRRAKLFFILPIIFMLMGCAVLQSLGVTVKPYSEMTPKEKITFLFKTYNKQYDDYLIQAAKPTLTETERVVLRTRKKIMVEVYPLIGILDGALVEGKPFDASTEKLIIDKLRQLGAKIQ